MNQPSSVACHVDRLAANLLKIVRSQRDLSQRRLAQLAGVPRSTIAPIESGTRQPFAVVLARILAGVDLELRITIAPYDDHDDVLEATESSLTPSELTDRQAVQNRFSEVLRKGLQHSPRQSELRDSD